MIRYAIGIAVLVWVYNQHSLLIWGLYALVLILPATIEQMLYKQ